MFVASFLGLPEMNLIPGRIEAAGEGTRFVGDGLRRTAAARRCRSGPARRPRDPAAGAGGIRPGEAPRAAPRSADASVSPSSIMARKASPRVGLQSRPLTVEIAPASGIAIGEEIGVFADLSDVHLFDPDTGQRLVSGPAEGGS